MVAFHFQFANQAGWKCDSCRKHGLEKRRRCKRIPCAQREPGESLVWARKGVGTTVCPRSLISAESLALIEEFTVRRRLGRFDVETLSARQVDAFTLLEAALAEEKNSGQHHTGNAA